MPIELALIAIVGLLAALLVFRRYNDRNEGADNKRNPNVEKRTPGDSRSKVAQKSTPYHAVSIKFGPNACTHARELEGKRFLSGAAPRLPLPECDVLDCKCRFVHHADRRTGDDRRSRLPRGFGNADTGSYEEERRKRTERRADDDVDDFF